MCVHMALHVHAQMGTGTTAALACARIHKWATGTHGTYAGACAHARTVLVSPEMRKCMAVLLQVRGLTSYSWGPVANRPQPCTRTQTIDWGPLSIGASLPA